MSMPELLKTNLKLIQEGIIILSKSHKINQLTVTVFVSKTDGDKKTCVIWGKHLTIGQKSAKKISLTHGKGSFKN